MINGDAPSLPYRACVGAALFNQLGQVWVGKRIFKANRKWKDSWQMPQGGIEKDEPPNVAVIRELKEETGVDQVEIIAEIDEWLKYDLPAHLKGNALEGKYRGQSQKWYALKFLGNDKNFSLNYSPNPEFSHWKWVNLEEIVSLAIFFKRDVYRLVAAHFRHIPKLLSNHEISL